MTLFTVFFRILLGCNYCVYIFMFNWCWGLYVQLNGAPHTSAVDTPLLVCIEFGKEFDIYL